MTNAFAQFAAFALLTWSIGLAPAASPPPEWAGRGRYRVLVSIDAVDTGGRAEDEGVAEIVIDWTAQLRALGISDRVDLGSLQVMQYDARSGKPRPYGNYGYARSPYDRPFRWADWSETCQPRPTSSQCQEGAP